MRARLALEEGRASQLPANMIHWLPLKRSFSITHFQSGPWNRKSNDHNGFGSRAFVGSRCFQPQAGATNCLFENGRRRRRASGGRKVARHPEEGLHKHRRSGRCRLMFQMTGFLGAQKAGKRQAKGRFRAYFSPVRRPLWPISDALMSARPCSTFAFAPSIDWGARTASPGGRWFLARPWYLTLTYPGGR